MYLQAHCISSGTLEVALVETQQEENIETEEYNDER